MIETSDYQLLVITFSLSFIHSSRPSVVFGNKYHDTMTLASIQMLSSIFKLPKGATGAQINLGSDLLKFAFLLQIPMEALLDALSNPTSSEVKMFIERYCSILVSVFLDNSNQRYRDELASLLSFLAHAAHDIFTYFVELLLDSILTDPQIEIAGRLSIVSTVSMVHQEFKPTIAKKLLQVTFLANEVYRPNSVVENIASQVFAILSDPRSNTEAIIGFLDCVQVHFSLIYYLYFDIILISSYFQFFMPGGSGRCPLVYGKLCPLNDKCEEALEELVANKFPLNSSQPDSASYSTKVNFGIHTSLYTFTSNCVY